MLSSPPLSAPKKLVIVLCCQSSHSIIFALTSLNSCIMSIFEHCCKNRVPPTTEFALFSQQEYRFEQGDNGIFNIDMPKGCGCNHK